MWLVYASIAHSGPPDLPEWLPEVDGDDPDDAESTVGGVIEGSGEPSTSADCGIAPSERLQDWSDASRGEAMLVGADRGEGELWLVATARIGSEVVHWRQGPYTASAESIAVTVSLPSSILASPLAESRKGTVSVRVIAQDESGAIVGRWSLPRLAFTMGGSLDSRPVLVPIDELPAPQPSVEDAQHTISADL